MYFIHFYYFNFKILGQAQVKQAELKAQAKQIENDGEIEQLIKSQIAELDHKKVLFFILPSYFSRVYMKLKLKKLKN